MPFATAQNYKLALNTETVWGTPLTTGAKYVRITGANLKSNISFVESQEISATHRETADVVGVTAGGGGTIDAELTFLTWEDALASLFGAAATGTTVRTLKPGRTLRSMTVQEEMTDITQFVSYPGAVFTSWGLNVQNGQILTSNFGFSSKRGVTAGATAIGTPAAANTNAVMDPLGSVQILTEGGTTIAAAASFTMNVVSDLITIPQLISADPAALYQGKFKVTGSVTFHKQDAALLTKYLNRTKTILAVKLGGASVKHIQILLQAVTITDLSSPASGSNPIAETYQYTATFDVTESTCKLIFTD
jgi:hypothetical protein